MKAGELRDRMLDGCKGRMKVMHMQVMEEVQEGRMTGKDKKWKCGTG